MLTSRSGRPGRTLFRFRLSGDCLLRTFLPDAFQEDGRGLVVAPFTAGEFGLGGDEFASEGAGEDGLRELVNVRLRLKVTCFQRVGDFVNPTPNV